MKNIIAAILSIPLIIAVGGITKFNIDLNNFINQGENDKTETLTQKIKGTEVHIVGTIHFEDDNIKREDLYNYIDSISPSIILFENNSKRVKRMVKRTDFLLQLYLLFKNRKKKEMERAVGLKYLKHHPNTKALPYEWEIRDKYYRKHKIPQKSQKMLDAILELYKQNLLTPDQTNTFKKFIELTKDINQYETLADINNSVRDSIVEQRQYCMYNELPKIVKERKELSEYLDFLPIFMSYWKTRNDAMVQNIIKQIELNPNKVIVVLNGYYHRYFLIEGLKRYATQRNFSIN